MKNLITFFASCAIAVLFFTVSCTPDLLNQVPDREVPVDLFWKTEDDALQALSGVYAAVRPCFDRDYHFDGHGEFVRSRSANHSATENNLRLGDAYRAAWDPHNFTITDNFDRMFRYLYGGINRANYVIDNVRIMMQDAPSERSYNYYRTIVAETRMLRALCYFRLISMWGDVPGVWSTVTANSQVASLSRLPIGVVKDSIISDLTYAYEYLPTPGSGIARGRHAKTAALALRGKVHLYWASWNNFGWPELDGFQHSAAAATAAYTAAAADFRSVIEDYGLDLFRGGEPGEIDELGKADILPNYYYLFIPSTSNDPSNTEFILYFTHGGQGSGQGEEYMRDFSGRNHEGSQVWVTPRFEIADRYQCLTSGDFRPPLVGLNRTDVADAFTRENSAVNPQSYAGRDYRMKSTIIWDYERCLGMTSLRLTGWFPFVYMAWDTQIRTVDLPSFPGFTADDVGLRTYNTDGTNSGYVFRKFVRNYAGQGRSDGDQSWPVIRLADVYLMYAEAVNELDNDPEAKDKAIALVNRIRYRAKLPALDASKTATKEELFKAIEQERIVELIAEGHRPFDLRRWRAIERAWVPPQHPEGVWRRDTWGVNRTRYFQNTPARTYEQLYIFRIPRSERDRNPNLTQNTPHL